MVHIRHGIHWVLDHFSMASFAKVFPRLGLHHRSRRFIDAVIGGAIVMVIAGAAVLIIRDGRQHAFKDHEREATNLAVALAEQTARYVQTVDQTITEIKSWASGQDLRTAESFGNLMRSAEIRRRLIEHRPNVLEAPSIAIVGADGEVLNTSRTVFTPGASAADRDFYKYLSTHDDPEIVIGSPGISRTTNRPSMFFARRVNTQEGAFAGFVVAVVDTAYLSDFYRSIGDRLHGSVTLLSRDGAMFVRYPPLADVAGEKLPQSAAWAARVAAGGGNFRSPGKYDGTPALVVVRPLRDYALVVDVILRETVILASWRHQAAYTVVGALGVMVGFIALTQVITGQFHRQRHQNAMLRQTASALRESERKSRIYAEMSADWFWEQDADFRFLNDAHIPMTSRPTDIGKYRWDLGDSAMNEDRWSAHKADLIARRPFRDFRWERIQVDGKRRYMSTSGDPVFDEAGVFLGYQGTGRDVSAEVESAAELRGARDRAEQAETLLRDAVDSMSQGFVIYDREDRFIMCNDAYERIHRQIYAEGADCLVAGMHLGDMLRHTIAHGAAGEEARGCEDEWVAARLAYHRRAEGELEQRLDDGSWYLITNRRMKNGGVAGLRVNITKRKQSEERMLQMAHHDGLTGLPNRTYLNDRLSHALEQVPREGEGFAVLALDLDRFKAINDGFGHAVGDRLLMLVAARLGGVIRASDMLARIGGDEFVILCTVADPAAAAELAQRVIVSMSEPFEMNDIQMRIGTSIGIALYPADGQGAESLLTNADTALYRAKSDGRSKFCFFEPEMDLRQRERWALEQDLRLAIGSDQLRLHYQPIFAAATQSIVGFEALLRWQHPERGDIPPMAFIQIAEETGLVLPIGAWVLEEACRTAAAWPMPKRVAVNLSAAQLRSGELPARVADILRRTGLPPSLLELEVTETMLIRDHNQALNTLHEIRDMGVQIACDDFGTGYSNFSYIQKLAFDRIKIDRSFVRELGVAPAALRIVQAILGMARSLGMEVTAEGVETEQQFSMLRAQGCGEIQGFLLGRPMPAELVPAVLRTDEMEAAMRAKDGCTPVNAGADGSAAPEFHQVTRQYRPLLITLNT
jgi:diguanylate cyclase (GGDEF)-like protein